MPAGRIAEGSARCQIDAGIPCSGTRPRVTVPSLVRNAQSRIGIRRCRVRACCLLLYGPAVDRKGCPFREVVADALLPASYRI